MSPDTTESREGGRPVGKAIERREDAGLLTGDAEYTDDLVDAETLHVAILRSQYGHARIEGLDTDAAEAHDGVVGVFTAVDVDEETPGTIPTTAPPPTGGPYTLSRDLVTPDRPMIAADRVRYDGESIAVVVAEDRYAAHDAADLIEVDFERLDAVTDAATALAADAPQVHEEAPDNVALDWEVGDADAVEDAFAAADRTVSLELENQRLAPNPMEPRTAVAEYAPSTGKLTVHMASQTPNDHQSLIAGALGLPEQDVRVIVPEVGGGFGAKSKFYPDEVLAAWVATKLGRRVAWTGTRTETMRTDAHGRGQTIECELAFDDDGTIHGLRADTRVNMGAYVSKVAPVIVTRGYATMLSGQYEIPAIYCRVVGAFTNTAPVDAYRGAGRPEATYVVERLVRRAADELGVDPAEVRRRNFVPAEAFPHETAIGEIYDSGNYARALDRLLDHVDYERQRERQKRLRDEGRYLGIGLSCFVESAGTPQSESGLVRVHPSGTVTAYSGTKDHGQGHRTTFAQVVAAELGIPYEDVAVVEGDTDQVPHGTGSYGSRSAMLGGNALVESARKVVEQARRVAAHHLEASPADIEFDDGDFHVAGAPGRSVGFQKVAELIHRGFDLPADVEPGLEATTFYRTETSNPFGAHAAVVEVDASTGEIEIERYVAVDDCGVQINPRIVEGQIHGGVAQGIGQALYESAVYDDSGTLVTGSMQDYAVPKAAHLPAFETDSTVTPSPTNDLGVKGTGESGTIGAPAAVVNAVVDALSPLDVEHVDMPLTPETVWRAVDERRNEN